MANGIISDFNKEAKLVVNNVRNQLAGYAVVKNEEPVVYDLTTIDEYTKLLHTLIPEVRKNASNWYEIEAANIDRNTIRSVVNTEQHKSLQFDKVRKMRAAACHFAIFGLTNGIVDVALSKRVSGSTNG